MVKKKPLSAAAAKYSLRSRVNLTPSCSTSSSFSIFDDVDGSQFSGSSDDDDDDDDSKSHSSDEEEDGYSSNTEDDCSESRLDDMDARYAEVTRNWKRGAKADSTLGEWARVYGVLQKWYLEQVDAFKTFLGPLSRPYSR